MVFRRACGRHKSGWHHGYIIQDKTILAPGRAASARGFLRVETEPCVRRKREPRTEACFHPGLSLSSHIGRSPATERKRGAAWLIIASPTVRSPATERKRGAAWLIIASPTVRSPATERKRGAAWLIIASPTVRSPATERKRGAAWLIIASPTVRSPATKRKRGAA